MALVFFLKQLSLTLVCFRKCAGVSFIEKFKLVVNTSNEQKTRIYVNRLCLTADVALIECNAAKNDGQVKVIVKGKSPCYECIPEEAQFADDNTPFDLQDCIIWSRDVFE